MEHSRKMQDKQPPASGQATERRSRLSQRQELYLRISAFNWPDRDPEGVLIMGAPDWRTARSLVRVDLGHIEHAEGKQATFYANAEGAKIAYPDRDS